MSTTLYLVRHTHVDVPSGICYGVTDVPTAPSFESEAEEVRQRLEGVSVDRCYCSPLSRCLYLAMELTEVVTPDERLKELDFGLWEMMSWEDIYREEGSKEWFDDYVNVATPMGESYRMMEDRIREFICDQPDGAHLLVVTHAGPIRAFLSLLTDLSVADAYDRSIGYGEVIRLEYDSELRNKLILSE